MKTLTKCLLAGLAACFTALPSLSSVDPGTVDLLNLIESYGVNVRFNTSVCDGTKGGAFKVTKGTPIVTLCPTDGGADDHNTVRHEVWHFIQYCRTPHTSTVLTPLLKDQDKYVEFISYSLSGSTVERIRSDYPDDHELVELEAFAAAELFDAKFIADQVRNHCTPISTNRPIEGA